MCLRAVCPCASPSVLAYGCAVCGVAVRVVCVRVPVTWAKWNLQRVAAHGSRTDFHFVWTARFFDAALGGTTAAVAFGRWHFSDSRSDFFVPLSFQHPS